MHDFFLSNSVQMIDRNIDLEMSENLIFVREHLYFILPFRVIMYKHYLLKLHPLVLPFYVNC